MDSTQPRSVARAAVIVGSAAAIFAALAWVGHVSAIWNATVLAVATFYVLVHLVPGPIFRLQSMPYTYQLHNNWGPRGFELQNLTYAAYHTHWYNRATHAAFPLEAWLWFLVAAHFGGAAATVALAGLLAAQAFSFGERRFALGLCGLWAAFAASSVAAQRALGPEALALAQIGLVGFGFWRFSGHWVEPLPPGTADNRAFLPLAECKQPWRVLPAAALGYLSEFSAGLPFRLVNGWLFITAQQLGFVPERSIGRAEADALAARIHREGWSAHPTTEAIVVAARALPMADRACAGVETPARAATVSAAWTSPALGVPSARAAAPIRLMACDAGASVWLLSIGRHTLLFDSWLDDPYVSGSRAFFSARRVEAPVIPAHALPRLDAIVLSSAEQDHCHPVTLARLDKHVPVVARREAARVAERAGFGDVTCFVPGEPIALLGGAIRALPLPGHGRNLAVVLRDEASGERVCIAQHGIDGSWLARNAQRVFAGAFAPDVAGRLVDTLCLGVHTTLLYHRLLPARLLGAASTIVPDPSDSASVVKQLAPRRVLFAHCTREHEQGFAVRHLLHYPSAADDVGYAKQVLGTRCADVAIEGLPAPAQWV
jgi:hypothetical protein